MAMFLKMRLLVALSSCMLTPSLRQKVMLPQTARSKTTGQWARLDSALATASNRDAAKMMATTASQAGSGVVRFDKYDELLVLSSGNSFGAAYIYTYTVFENQVAMTDWTPLGDFQGREMEMQGGVDTMTQNDGYGEPHPIFFWVRAPAKDFDALKTAFAKIVAPTRAEAGSMRYDQGCTVSGDDAFCFENVWYRTLPDAQDAHMSTSHMATFFGETASLVLGWSMATLKPLPELGSALHEKDEQAHTELGLRDYCCSGSAEEARLKCRDPASNSECRFRPRSEDKRCDYWGKHKTRC